MKHADKNRNDRSTAYRNIGYGVMIPTLLAACVVVGIGGGYFLDEKLGTGPWLTLLGLILGVVAGFRELFRILKKMGRNQ